MAVRLLRPRLILQRRPIDKKERIVNGFHVYQIAHRYAHHASASGYDRIVDYVGDYVKIGLLRHLAGETIYRLPALYDSKRGGVYEYSRHDWVLEQEVISLINKKKRSLFHFLYGEKSYKRAWRAAGRNSNRIVATIHHPPEHFVKLFRSTDHFRYLDRVIVMCQDQKHFMEDITGKGRVSVVHYGVNTQVFHPPLNNRRCPSPKCVFAGFHERDHEILPDVVRGVLAAVKDCQFIMVSKDPRCAEIAKNHTRAKLLVNLSDDDYASVLRQAWLLVMPLRLSAATTVALEAMSSGLPVITTEGGIRDYIVPDGGVLCPVGDADTMIGETVDLLQNQEKLHLAQLNAREHALKFAWPLVARHTNEVYRQVMSS